MAAKELIAQVCRWMDQDSWKYDLEAEHNVIRTGVSLKCKLNSVKMVLLFNDLGYTSTALCPLKADEKTRAAAMEYITRANYGLRNGNFEMDVSDGEVRYKVYVNAKDTDQLGKGIIEDSIVLPALMFERYGDGLAAIMMGFSDPETEIKKAEEK